MLQFFVDYLMFPLVVVIEFTFLFYGGLPNEAKAKAKKAAPARAETPSVAPGHAAQLSH